MRLPTAIPKEAVMMNWFLHLHHGILAAKVRGALLCHSVNTAIILSAALNTESKDPHHFSLFVPPQVSPEAAR